MAGKPDPTKGEERKGRGSERDPKAEHSARKPSADVVADYHANSDVDAHSGALHHTLGFGSAQASPGDHTHNADSPDSSPLWRGVTLADPSTSASAAELSAAIAALNALIRQKSVG